MNPICRAIFFPIIVVYLSIVICNLVIYIIIIIIIDCGKLNINAVMILKNLLMKIVTVQAILVLKSIIFFSLIFELKYDPGRFCFHFQFTL